jgi:hypothetical protein
MMRTVTDQPRGQDDRDRMDAMEDARRAATAAAWIAGESEEWSRRYAIAEDDAADAIRAAIRARIAAERAERAGNREDAIEAARSAWAAVLSAREADQRVVAAVAEALVGG